MGIRAEWRGVWLGVGFGVLGAGILVIWHTNFAGWCFIALGMAIIAGSIVHLYGTALFSALAGIIMFGVSILLWPAAKTEMEPSIDNTILMECRNAPLPEIMPDVPLYVIQMVGSKYDAGFGSFGQQPGEKLPKMDVENANTGMCKLTNYGQSPVINVTFDVTFKYLEAITTEKGLQSRNIVLEKILKRLQLIWALELKILHLYFIQTGLLILYQVRHRSI